MSSNSLHEPATPGLNRKQPLPRHEYVAELDGTKWYLLLRGAVLRRCAESEEMERANIMVQSIRELAVSSTGNSSAPLHPEELTQLDDILRCLLKRRGGPEIIDPVDAPALLRGVHGRVMLSARSVLLELPEPCKAAWAAQKWLGKARATKNRAPDEAEPVVDFEDYYDEPQTPRSSKRIISMDKAVYRREASANSREDLKEAEFFFESEPP